MILQTDVDHILFMITAWKRKNCEQNDVKRQIRTLFFSLLFLVLLLIFQDRYNLCLKKKRVEANLAYRAD